MRRRLPVVVLPHLAVVLGFLVACITAALVTSQPMSFVPGGVAVAWLVLNASPVVVGGVEIGVLPLMLPLLFGWAISRRVYRAIKVRVSLADLVVLSVGALVVPALFSVLAVGLLAVSPEELALSAPSVLEAVAKTLAVHAAAFVIGMRRRLWLALARRFGVPEWLVDAARTAWHFMVLIAITGLALWALGAAVHYAEVARIFQTATGPGEVALIVVMTLLYLPNAAIYGAAMLLGAEVHAGLASLSLFSVHWVALPPLPIFAAAPATMPAWAMAALVLPAGAGAWLAIRHRPDLKQAAASAVFAGAFVAMCCFLASGNLGVYGHTGTMSWLAGLLAVVWLGVVGVVAAGLRWLKARRAPGQFQAGGKPAEQEGIQEEGEKATAGGEGTRTAGAEEPVEEPEATASESDGEQAGGGDDQQPGSGAETRAEAEKPQGFDGAQPEPVDEDAASIPWVEPAEDLQLHHEEVSLGYEEIAADLEDVPAAGPKHAADEAEGQQHEAPPRENEGKDAPDASVEDGRNRS